MNLVLSYGDLSRPGGYRSRVFGELAALDQQNGLDPYLMVFDRNPAIFENSFSMDIPHRVFDRSAALQFYPAVAGLAKKNTIRLVHAHNLYSAALALSARWRYGYKVVLDYHGRIPEEYVFLGKGGRAARRSLEFLERWCVQRSDHVVAVSHKLAEYLEHRYGVSHQRMSVIPCCADGQTFYWEPVGRMDMRNSMKLSGKFVCAHVGSFFEWYDPDMVVAIFQQILGHVDAYLLVLTSEVDRAKAYLGSRLPPESFLVRAVQHQEVPALLNASDLGFLLLRPSPNIQTSSPAKFAEYLNCGLPVLITPEVGDFSGLVARTGTGALVEHQGVLDLAIVDRILRGREQMAYECAAAGRSLTWQTLSGKWHELVSS